MKYLSLLLLSLTLLMTTSCKKEEKINSSVNYPLHLHIQADFDNDNVELLIDDETVFDGVVTTNDVLGLSETIDLEQAEGPFVITMVLNGDRTEVAVVDMKTELYVGIGFDRWNNTLNIDTSLVPFMYD